MAALASTPPTLTPPRPSFLPRRPPGCPRRRAPPFPRYAASASSRNRAPRPRPASPSPDATTVRRGVMREYVEAAREMAPDGGPPRWFAPLDPGGAGGRVPGAPTLLYLPGIDGVGLGLIRHHERLSKMFEMWCLHIPVEDRTPFERLVEYVERTVKSDRSRAPDRPVYLVGESVGACIALAVAARNRDIDLVLILINPGTSFHKSRLHSLSAFLDLVPDPFHLSTPQFLNFLTGNFMKMSSTFDGAGQALSEITTGLLPSLMFLADILPKESIVWKMKMLRTASSFVNSRLHAVKAQSLVLASGNDELLPSHEEAERLQGTLEKCRIRHFRDNGHKILLEDEFDLATTIKGAGYYRRSRQTDFVSDYLPLTAGELEKAIDRDRVLNFATDPVMLSTLPDGKIVRGLAGLPREGPVVLVGYHMLMGFELGPLVTGVLRNTGIHIRGLAHPFMFSESSEQLMPDSSHFDLHRIMGAVPVTPVNFYKLLSEKNFVLLYPGGAREALHRKGEEYKLFWPEQSEFVRMASRFGATIIPFGVVGEDDLCDVSASFKIGLELREGIHDQRDRYESGNNSEFEYGPFPSPSSVKLPKKIMGPPKLHVY
ncbi:acyltransferase-like protein At1g54570, chloroplastic isoform X3 [Brachypodium distachyon]|uniref:acyltransferase-like protein At1g54570, chloroplastic isoform X3 n=1 Tax=Brachypodium distachyon TaxID=15368 RepID=UPI000D0E113C|nr:acyltransferase-like protein At1g54570, chloroplastic isoform X3 [Brachypodium distachyon]|eukprot:XP_024310260.1 acyltransferase-like protein At1g54570, chloroplastic isoform X3 [Brachypodium distachyon]